MVLEKKVACVGQLTTLVLLLSPFPSFVFCHKKTLEKNKQISSISFSYLLANFVCNAVWLGYSFKVESPDLIILNLLGSVLTAFFLMLFLYVKVKMGQHKKAIG